MLKQADLAKSLGITLFTAGLLALILSLAGGGLWEGMPLSIAGLEAEYCENNRMEALVRQPANSWSNFAYFFLGMLVIWGGHSLRKEQRDHSPIDAFPGLRIAMAAAFFFLCFGSFHFHASLTRIGQRLDMTGTYGLTACLIIAALYLLAGRRDELARVVTILLVIASFLFFYIFKWAINAWVVLPAMMGTSIFLAAVLYFRSGRNMDERWIYIGLAALVLAGVVRTLDVNKVGCAPESVFQGHALWHLLSGWSAFSLFSFLRSAKEA